MSNFREKSLKMLELLIKLQHDIIMSLPDFSLIFASSICMSTSTLMLLVFSSHCLSSSPYCYVVESYCFK